MKPDAGKFNLLLATVTDKIQLPRSLCMSSIQKTKRILNCFPEHRAALSVVKKHNI